MRILTQRSKCNNILFMQPNLVIVTKLYGPLALPVHFKASYFILIPIVMEPKAVSQVFSVQSLCNSALRRDTTKLQPNSPPRMSLSKQKPNGGRKSPAFHPSPLSFTFSHPLSFYLSVSLFLPPLPCYNVYIFAYKDENFNQTK